MAEKAQTDAKSVASGASDKGPISAKANSEKHAEIKSQGDSVGDKYQSKSVMGELVKDNVSEKAPIKTQSTKGSQDGKLPAVDG